MSIDHMIVAVCLAAAGVIAAILRYVIATGSTPVTTEAARKHYTNLDGNYRPGRTLR